MDVHVIPKRISVHKTLPSCNNCKYQISYGDTKVCNLFSHLLNEDNIFDFYVNVDLCRNNSAFCGKNGKYFKSK